MLGDPAADLAKNPLTATWAWLVQDGVPVAIIYLQTLDTASDFGKESLGVGKRAHDILCTMA